MKKFLSGLLMAVISFGCLIPAMGQEPKLEEVTKIDNYMQNVVEITHNPLHKKIYLLLFQLLKIMMKQ